jgi:hypothetical protein
MEPITSVMLISPELLSYRAEAMHVWVWFMLIKATFNTISAISWGSVLLVEETEIPGENHRPVSYIHQHGAVRLWSDILKSNVTYQLVKTVYILTNQQLLQRSSYGS